LLSAGGAVSVDTIDALDNVDMDAGGAISSDSITGAFTTLVSDDEVSVGSIVATRFEASGTTLDIGAILLNANAFAASGAAVLSSSGGDIVLGSVDAARSVAIDSAG